MDTMLGTTHIWNPGSVGASCDPPYSYRFMVLHDNNGRWEPDFISLAPDTELLVSEMKEAGLYEIAPYWTRFTELLVTNKCGSFTHGDLISRAMDISYKKNGDCSWPKIPEDCYAEAFRDICCSLE